MESQVTSRADLFLFLYCIILLTSFSWWLITPQEVARGGFAMASIVIRVIPMLTIFIILIVIDAMRRWKGLKKMLTTLFFLLLVNYTVVSASSALMYGQSYASIWKSLELFIVVYFGACIYSLNLNSDFKKEKFLSVFVYVAIAVVVLNFVLAIINPEAGFRGKRMLFQGTFPYMNPNGLGFLSLLGLLFLAIKKKKGFLGYFLIPLLFVAFVMAQSRTSYIVFLLIILLSLCGIALHILMNRKLNIVSIAALGFLLLIFTVLIILVATGDLEELLVRGQSQEDLQELSGRTFVWQAATLSIKEAPLFGYGIGTESKMLPLKYPHIIPFSQDTGIGSTHSTIFESLLGAGFLGAGFYLLYFHLLGLRAILTMAISNLSNYKSFVYKFALMALIVVLFRSFTGATLCVLSFEWMLFVLLYSIRAFPWQTKNVLGQQD